jgi:hypothetical protein
MSREKDEGCDYNGRRGELIAYDHTPLDGEYFLQVGYNWNKKKIIQLK